MCMGSLEDSRIRTQGQNTEHRIRTHYVTIKRERMSESERERDLVRPKIEEFWAQNDI